MKTIVAPITTAMAIVVTMPSQTSPTTNAGHITKNTAGHMGHVTTLVKTAPERAPGHCSEATFQNMLGGSTKRCFWINSNAWNAGMACVLTKKDKINNPTQYTHAVILPTTPPSLLQTQVPPVII